MTPRESLRASGAAIRERLGLPDPGERELAPGMTGLVDEVVYGRIWARPGLGLEDRMLATLSALACVQRLPQLAAHAGAALHIGMAPRLLQEAMIHCSMYTGIATAGSALAVVADVLAERGIAVAPVSLPEADLDELQAAGRRTMRELHAERAEAGYASPDSAAAVLYATAIEFLYGEIWNRPGIERRQRMICSVAAFTATRLESQQAKFFRSALNVGLTREAVLEIIMQTGPYSGFPPALNALAVAERVLADGAGD